MTKDAYASYSNSFKSYAQDISSISVMTKEEEQQIIPKIINNDDVDGKARQRLIEGNLRLVIKIARHYDSYGMDLDDLINEGNIGLMQAIDKYDPSKGTKFSTYASFWIKQKVIRALANKSRTIRLPVCMTQDFNKILKYMEEYEAEHDCQPDNETVADALGLAVSRVEAAKDHFENYGMVHLDAISGDEDSDRSYEQVIEDAHSVSPFEALASLNEDECIKKFLNELPERERKIVQHRFGLDTGKKKTLEAIGEELQLTKERIRQLEKLALKKLKTMMEKENYYG